MQIRVITKLPNSDLSNIRERKRKKEQSPRTSFHGVSSPRTNTKRKLPLDASSSFRETLQKIKRKRSKKDIRSRGIIAHAIRLKGTDGIK